MITSSDSPVNVTPEMRVCREEIIGPVLSVMHVDTLEHAIALVNSDPRGNGTSIFTENGAAVRKYSRRIEVGMVGVNIGVAASPAYFPFSGWKDSFFGDLRAHGWDAVEFFTRKKSVMSRYFLSGKRGNALLSKGRSTSVRPRKFVAEFNIVIRSEAKDLVHCEFKHIGLSLSSG